MATTLNLNAFFGPAISGSKPIVWDGDLSLGFSWLCRRPGSKPTVWDGDLGRRTSALLRSCVPSPQCGMATGKIMCLNSSIGKSSKPTVWDGDYPWCRKRENTCRVPSPLGGMVTFQQKLNQGLGQVVSSPRCGMVTYTA